MKLAGKLHKYQKRDDGSPYYDHVHATYTILRCVTNDEDVLCAALLHDVLEDTDTDYAYLKNEFGKKVADLVVEVTKVDRQFPNLKTKEGYMIKLADRLHNISTSKGKKTKKYLKKTMF